ncbi:EAL domain-containing protein [Enterovibrio calviensis]|uniref:EAL domain-containing protein n=1 Tax=Enterovibrio calviensis TaxID=91359 RepID=UPI000484C922|nr:EAL domain-containing protein [Enterovibrio calviensis]
MALVGEQEHATDGFSHGALLTRAVLVFFGCLFTALLAIYLLRQPGSSAFTWYANGLAIALITLAPKSQRLFLIGTAFGAIVLANILFGDALMQSVQLALANTSTIAVGSLALAHINRTSSPFISMPAFYVFVLLVVVISPLFGAISGGFILHKALSIPLIEIVMDWYFGDVIGILSITPFTFILLYRPNYLPSSLVSVKALGLIIGIGVLCGYVLSHVAYPFIAIAFALILASSILDRLSAFAAAFTVSLVLDFLLMSPSTNLVEGLSTTAPSLLLPPVAGAMFIGVLLAVKSARLQEIQKMSDEKASLFSDAMDVSVVGMVMASPDGTVLNTNRSFLAMLDLNADELDGSDFNQLIFHADRQKLREQCHDLAMANNTHFQISARLLTKKKRVIWTQIGVSAVQDRWSGEITNFIYQIRDIDKERRIDTERNLWAQKFEFALGINRITVYEMATNTKYIQLSENAFQAIGINAFSIRKMYEWMARIHPEDLREYQHSISQIGSEALAMEYRILDDNNTYRWIRDCSQPVENKNEDAVEKVIGTITDISHERDKLSRSTQQGDSCHSLEAGHIAVWEYHRDTDELVWDAEMYAIFGLTNNDVINKQSWSDLLHSDDQPQFDALFTTMPTSQPHDLHQIHVRSAANLDENTRYAIMAKSTDDPQHLVGICTNMPNIASQAQHATNSLLTAAIHASNDGVIVLDANLNIQAFNQSSCDMMHCCDSDVGKPIDSLFLLFDGDQLLTFEHMLKCASGEYFSINNVFWLQTARGVNIQIALRAKPALSEVNTLEGWIITLQHISKASWVDDSNKHVLVDPLTGLPNRRDFEGVLQHYIDSETDKPGEHIVAVIKLKGLRSLSDLLGKPARDQIIKSSAIVLRSMIKSDEYLARIDDNKFAVLLPQHSLIAAKSRAENIVARLDQLQFQHDSPSLSVSSAIGLVAIDDQYTAALLSLYHADIALTSALALPYEKVAAFDGSVPDNYQPYGNDNLLQQIDAAISNNAFTLLCMPIVAHRKDLTTWHEVLIRMITDDGKLLLPHVFFNAAEKTGRLINIERWVFREVLETQGKALQESGLSIAINISSSAFYDDTFIEHCIALIKKSPLPPANLCIEIHQSTLLIDKAKAKEVISSFRELGCEVAIDNFGSDVGVFSDLKTLNITLLKIDSSLISLMKSSRVEQRIVESIKQISDSMNVKTAATKVNNEDDYQQVKLACLDYSQGYVYGEPTPLTRIISSSKAGISHPLIYPKSAS